MKPQFVVVLLVFATAQTATAQGVKYSKNFKANLKGDLLVLDVGGLFFNGNHPMDPFVTTAAQCKAWCDRLVGCSGWTFCNRRSGCGSGCKAYAQQHPTPQHVKDMGLPPQRFDPSVPLPYPWFGPLSGGGFSCTQSDPWPYGLCSLKKVANPKKPQFWSKNAAEGWISGTITLPAACKGLSGTTCKRCQEHSDPTTCLACARKASANQLNVATALVMARDIASIPSLTDGCAACASLDAKVDKDRCINCLARGRPCGRCAADKIKSAQYLPHGDINLPACLACSAKFPKTYSECAACSTPRYPQKQQRCVTCISRTYKNLCPWPQPWPPSPPSCVGIGFGDPEHCFKCVNSDPNELKQCEKCAATARVPSDCYNCGLEQSAAERQACYKKVIAG